MQKKLFSLLIVFLFSADIFADNYSLSFGSGNDYVEVDYDISHDMVNTLTMEAWVNPTDNGWSNVMMKGSYGYALALSGDGGPGSCGSSNRLVYWDQGSCGSTIRSNLTYSYNEWQHVAVTVEDIGSQLKIYFYLNGTQDGPYYSNEVAISNGGNTQSLYIGRQGECSCNYFGGNMDELRLWNSALTQTEIQSYMSTSPTGSESGLVGYWNCNEGSGLTAADQTSNGNDGTLISMDVGWSTDVPPTPGEVSDDDVLIEELTLSFTSYQAIESSALQNSRDYYLKISGTYSAASGHLADAAYYYSNSPPAAAMPWTWSGLNTQHPYPQGYNADHIYYYYFTSDGTTEEFGFEDGGGYGDNSGSLTIQIWEVGDQDPPPAGGNHSLDFSSGNYARIPMSESLSNFTNFTIEFWYYQTGFSGGDERIVGTEYYSGSKYGVDNQHGDWSSYLYDGTNASSLNYWNPADNTPSIIQNTWHHFAVTYDGNHSRFFLNGIMLKEEIASLSGFGDPNQDLVINRHTWASGSSSRLSGQLDELRISNVARYTSDFTPPTYEFIPDANTMGLWHFNQDFNDYSGNGNNGTHQGSDYSSNTPDFTDPPPLPSLTSITIDGTSGYRFLSSPVSGTIYGDLLDELWTQGMAGSDDPNNGGANVWTWNNSWNPITDLATDNYTSGSGVLVYVFADTDFDGTDDLPVALTVDGTQNTSPVTIATNTNSWNLLGNPYGLALDVNQLLTDNSVFNTTVYVYDNELTAYKTHNGVTGDLAEGLISPFSGFWIQAGADGNSFEFTEESIVNSYGSAGRSTTEDETGSAVFTFHYQEHSSSVYFSFSPEGHINLDPADASRLLPMEARSHLTSMIHESGKSLSINNLPFDLSTDISMDMDVMMLSPVEGGYTTQEQDVTMEWDLSNIPEGMVFTLLDNTTSQTIDLDALEAANITLPNKGILSLESSGFMGTYPELDESQFTLTIQAATTATDADPVPDVFALHRAYPNPFNPSTLIGYDLPRDSHVFLEIFDLNGRLVKTLINGYFRAGKHQVAWNADQISSGIYLVRLVTGKKVFNQKITYLK